MSRRHKELLFEEFASDAGVQSEVDYIETPVSSAMFRFVTIASVVLIVGLVARLIYLNVAQRTFYTARAATNVNIERQIPAQRGTITDRYGEVLAKNTETFSVFVDAAGLLKDRQVLSETLNQLSAALDEPIEALEQAIAAGDYESSAQVPVVRNISPEQAISVRGLNLQFVAVANDLRREYIDGPIFSSVIGYTGSEQHRAVITGKTGLESVYNDQLRGVDGVFITTRDARGTVLDQRLSRDPVSGNSLTTTLDAGLQRFFYQALSTRLRELGVFAGVGLALDPKTGEVLSLVSLPSYDNNIFVTPGMGQERGALVTDNVRKPLFNRAVSGAYNPASTIKPLVALAALHEGVVTPETTMYSKGYIEIPNPYVPDKPSRFVEFNMHENGWVTARKALAVSSNVFFYSAGGGFEHIKGLGIERLRHYWQKFGLGQKTGIDLGPEVSGFLPSIEEKEERTSQPWRLGDTFNVSIGQGDLLVSPIQLINYIAGIANDGIMYKPRLVTSISNGTVNQPEVLVDYSDWELELNEVQSGMRDGVAKEYGTSYRLSDLPFNAAAKTGSAQTNNNTKTNAFFVGYAPYEDPRIVVLVLIENSKEGSLNAVPVAKEVLNWYYENRLNKQDTE